MTLLGVYAIKHFLNVDFFTVFDTSQMCRHTIILFLLFQVCVNTEDMQPSLNCPGPSLHERRNSTTHLVYCVQVNQVHIGNFCMQTNSIKTMNMFLFTHVGVLHL